MTTGGCDNSARTCVYVVYEQPHGYEDSYHALVVVYAHEDDAKAHVGSQYYKYDYEAWPLVDGRT